MVEIIPAIMTESAEEFVRQVHMLERAGVKRVHLDVADGIFVPMRTILGHPELRRMQTNMMFDIHLMVAHPEIQCSLWCTIPSASRFIIHVEATSAFPLLREHAKEQGKELVAALNPETRLERLEPIVASIDMVQFMTVHPGAQGRSFVTNVMDRVTEFHSAHPNVPIMIDGGITPHTIAGCVRAGATHVVSGSYVMRATDQVRAIHELQAASVL